MSEPTRCRRRAIIASTLVAGFTVAAALAGPLLSAEARSAPTGSVASFYRGKTIRFLIGGQPGSGYDVYARLLARRLGDHIPGRPALIPENMPAAGGMALLNSAYNTGPFDGTLIFSLHFILPLYQVLGSPGVRYDIAKMKPLGRLLASNTVIGVSTKSKSGVASFDDALARQAVIGSTGATSNSTLFPTILNRMAGTRFKVVPGYSGDAAVFLAMERGEIDGFGSYSYLTFKSVHPDYLTKKLFNPIVQWGALREQAWPDTPTAVDVAKTALDKEAMAIVSAGPDIGFSYFMPPGVPDDRAKALQDAFEATIKDPAFLADAKNAKLALRPASARELGAIVSRVLDAPKDAIARVAELTKPAD